MERLGGLAGTAAAGAGPDEVVEFASFVAGFLGKGLGGGFSSSVVGGGRRGGDGALEGRDLFF